MVDKLRSFHRSAGIIFFRFNVCQNQVDHAQNPLLPCLHPTMFEMQVSTPSTCLCWTVQCDVRHRIHLLRRMVGYASWLGCSTLPSVDDFETLSCREDERKSDGRNKGPKAVHRLIAGQVCTAFENLPLCRLWGGKGGPREGSIGQT